MSLSIQTFLVIYFVLFFGVAMAWRSFRVWQLTGVNAFRLREEAGAEAITGRYFKLFPLLILVLLAVHGLSPELYRQLGVITVLELAPLQMAGMVVMVLALGWTVVAQVHMGQSWRIGIDYQHRTPLITSGVFRYSRNPIFVGMMASVAGLFAVLPCALTLLLLVMTVALIQIQVSLEEQHLQRLHGDDYADYCRRVPRWL
jgi:protein-S-isoprenylcysteine O-methyltransferase Ste14